MTALLKSSAFYSTLIAAVALALSQAPPIYDWCPRETVDVQVSDRIGINNTVGYTSLFLLLDLQNTGNRDLTLGNLRLDLTYPNSSVKTFTLDSFQKFAGADSSPTYIPVTTISLPKASSWAEMVLFVTKLSPSDEEQLNDVRLSIFDSILKKTQATAYLQQQNNRAFVEASPDTVASAIELFDRELDIEKGEYQATVRYSIGNEERIAITFKFTIYAFHLRMLKSQTDDYKYGWGIYMPKNAYKEVWTPVSLLD